jgi:hypothetical protein
LLTSPATTPHGGMGERSEDGDSELLDRHRPYLKYDSQEAYRAASAAMFTDNRSNVLTRADGSVIAREPSPIGRLHGLGPCRYLDGERPALGDCFRLAPRTLPDAGRMQDDRPYANRVYGRLVVDEGRTWLQYWIFYYYDQKQLRGFGSHEGDWELVQVAVGPGGQPELVTFAHHESAIGRRWDEVERFRSRAGEHPVVYVSPFSHASYFEPGLHFYRGGVDNPDGMGFAVLSRLEPLGDWAAWPGRWGSSKGVLARLTGGRLGGRSPASPACQSKRWASPAAFHRRARLRKGTQVFSRVVRIAGKATFPLEPGIAAHLEGRQLVVRYAIRNGELRRVRYLYLTAHSLDKRGKVLASRSIRIRSRGGTVRITLPHAPQCCIVRVSAFNIARQRSGVEGKLAVQADFKQGVLVPVERRDPRAMSGTEAPNEGNFRCDPDKTLGQDLVQS